MKLRHSQLYPALALAIALQLTIAWSIGYALNTNNPISISGALDKGEDGLFVGVGLAGSFEETSDARSEAPKPQGETVEPEANRETEETHAPVEPEPELEQQQVPESIEISEHTTSTVKEPRPKVNEKTQPKVNKKPKPNGSDHISREEIEVSEHSEETNEAPIEESELKRDDKQSIANIEATGTGETSTTGGTQAEQQSYLSRILAHAARFKRYPQSARQQGVTGTVHVNFYLKKNGRIKNSKIIKSSGDPNLDQAALDVLLRASPFPAIPNNLSKDGLALTLPIEFSLNSTKKLL